MVVDGAALALVFNQPSHGDIWTNKCTLTSLTVPLVLGDYLL